MATHTTELPQKDQSKTRRSLIYGMLLWFVHLNAVNALSSVACKWGWLDFHVADMPGVQLVDVIITVVAAVLMALLIYIPWKNWQRLKTSRRETLEEAEVDRGAFTSFLAIGVNSFLLLFMLAVLVPIFALRGCGQA